MTGFGGSTAVACEILIINVGCRVARHHSGIPSFKVRGSVIGLQFVEDAQAFIIARHAYDMGGSDFWLRRIDPTPDHSFFSYIRYIRIHNLCSCCEVECGPRIML